jgi:hypothetical protein
MKRFLNIGLVVAVVLLGFTLGRMTGNGLLPLAAGPKVYPLPPPPPQPSAATEKMDTVEEHKLIVETPAEGGTVQDAFLVTGRADAAIRTVSIEVLDADQRSVFTTSVDLSSTDEFTRFSINGAVNTFGASELPNIPERRVLVITGLDKAGVVVESVERHLLYGKGDMVEVSVQFQNAKKDVGADLCATTTPVQRFIPSDTNVYRAAVEALLAGPTAEEVSGGYSTSIPAKVILKDIGADSGGIVTANFNATLDRNVAGSCRVGAIRNQIERTLLQFPEVHGVVIAVDGDVDNALQP